MSKVRLPEPECVKMKRRASLRIYRMLSKMTREEEIAYWEARAKEMIELREKAIEDDLPPLLVPYGMC